MKSKYLKFNKHISKRKQSKLIELEHFLLSKVLHRIKKTNKPVRLIENNSSVCSLRSSGVLFQI